MIKRFNFIKEDYDEHYFENFAYKEIRNSPRNKNRLNEIIQYKTGGKLLEIGCGKGGFLNLAKEFFEIEGIDISPFAVNFANQNFSDKIILCDVEKINLPYSAYDVVVAFNILEHLNNPNFVLTQIFNSLKVNGVLIGSVPNNHPLIGKFYTSLTNFIDRTHKSTYATNHWITLFQLSGFREFNFFGEVVFSINFNRYVRNSFWKYMSFNFIFLCHK